MKAASFSLSAFLQGEGEACGLLYRRHRAQIGHDGVEVGRSDRGVVMEAHRRLEVLALPVDAGGDGFLDLAVGPSADALGLARGDVARRRHAPGAGEIEAA